jgi:hypothetical protein
VLGSQQLGTQRLLQRYGHSCGRLAAAYDRDAVDGLQIQHFLAISRGERTPSSPARQIRRASRRRSGGDCFASFIKAAPKSLRLMQ